MKRIALGSLLIALIAVAGFWFVGAFNDLFQRITPGVGFSPSTSMKPYEINLRTKVPVDRHAENTGKVHEWKLSIPRAFVTTETGSNGAVGQYGSEKNSSYFAHLAIELDEDLKTINPFHPAQKKYGPRHIVIRLRNGITKKWRARNHLCIPWHLDSEIAKSFGESGYSVKFNPNPGILLCDINMSVDGWDVNLGVSKSIYNKSDLACGVVSSFLDEYTVKRDDLR